MHICLLTTGFPTPFEAGKYAFVDQLACAWADMGHQITVIYPIPAFVELFNKERFYKSEWDRYTSRGNMVHIISPRYFSASDKTILGIDTKVIAYNSFQKAARGSILKLKKKPDALYGHFLPSGCHAGDIGYELNIPAFCAFGESSLWSIKGYNIENIKSSLSKLSGIISVSTENKRVLIENQLYREKDIVVFPNGVDLSVFTRKNKKEARKKYEFPEDEFIGVFTGSFNSNKGIMRAQEAAIKAGNIKMIYIGSGAYKPKGSNVLFCGRLQHELIPEYLNAADFFILPTKAEGCCNAIIEAMACGLPIISSNGAYNDDILSDLISIRTAPDDIEAMSRAICSLRDNPEKRKKMSLAAERASMKFDINQRASRIIKYMIQNNKR